jgi:hypothetical protein
MGSRNPTTAVWTCDAKVKSLTDVYSKMGLNLQEGNDLTFEVLSDLLPRQFLDFQNVSTLDQTGEYNAR